MAPTKKSKRTLVGQDAKEWTKGETFKLISSIKKQLKDRDELPYSSRIKLLNWQQIKPKGKTVNERKSRLEFLIKKVRRIRSLAEILYAMDHDIIDMKKSKTSIALFSEKMRTGYVGVDSKRHQKLKEHYNEESKQLPLECMHNFSNETAKRSSLTPLKLFVKHNDKKYTAEDQLKEQYKKLDEIEKLFWIRKAITANKEVDIKTILTDEEFTLFQSGPKRMKNPFSVNKMKLPLGIDLKPPGQRGHNSDAAEPTEKTSDQDNLNEETQLKKNDDNQTTPFAQGSENTSFDSLKRKRTEEESDYMMKLVKNNQIKLAGGSDLESISTNNIISENMNEKPLRMKHRRMAIDFPNKKVFVEVQNVEKDKKVAEPLNNGSTNTGSGVHDLKEVQPVVENQTINNSMLNSLNENVIETTGKVVIYPLRQEKANDFTNKIPKLEFEEPKQIWNADNEYSVNVNS